MSPRVKASMAEVSTDFSPSDPGVMVLSVEDCVEHTDENSGRTMYEITNKIEQVLEGSQSDVGRKIKDRIHIHKKDGTSNEFGVAQLKRYFEVTLGDEKANDPEADTDWLKGMQFKAQVGIEQYTVPDKLTGKNETRKRNQIERLAPV